MHNAVHCGSPLSVDLDLGVSSANPDFSKSAQVTPSFCAVDLFCSIKLVLYVELLYMFLVFRLGTHSLHDVGWKF